MAEYGSGCILRRTRRRNRFFAAQEEAQKAVEPPAPSVLPAQPVQDKPVPVPRPVPVRVVILLDFDGTEVCSTEEAKIR